MAEEKRKSSSKQVLDIHKPGKTMTSDTSKPVIVSNRQILRDPMIAEDAAPAVVETTKVEPAVSSTAPEVPKDEEVTYGPRGSAEESDEKPDTEAPKPVEKPVVADETDTVPAEPEAAVTTPEEMQAAEAKSDVEPAAPAKVEPPEEKASTPEKGRLEPSADLVAEIAKSDDDGTTEDEVAAPELISDEAAAAAEDEQQTKEEAELQKLIVSKKYFLPINSLEKRRAERFVALGILLSLILAFAWADIALDAGLIHIDGISPLTHFFSS